MSARRISLCLSGTDLHLLYLDLDGFPYERLQTPDNIWHARHAVPNPNRTTFQAVKLVQGAGSLLFVIGLDTAGRLSCIASDEEGRWAGDFARLPNQSGIAFTCFDAVGVGDGGIVVVAVSTGQVAYTQTTLDGVNWSQPGWSNQPTSSYPYPSDPYGVSENYEAPFPPTFMAASIGSSQPWEDGLGAPVIAGLAPGPHENFPVVLCTDENGDWQWGDVPSISETTYHRGTGKQITIKSLPYQAIIRDLYFGPILLLLGADGNIYCNIPTDDLLWDWTHHGEALPNPNGLFFTKAVVAAGYPNSPDHAEKLQVIAVSKQDQLPYLIWHDGTDAHFGRSAWNWAGPLPMPFPAKKVTDFDVAGGATALVVAYLATDGTFFTNSQDQQGAWDVYGPLN